MRRASAALDVSVAASAASSPKKQAARAFIMAVLLLSTRALQRMCESTLIPRMVTVESLRGRARAWPRTARVEGALAGGAPSACPRARPGAARREADSGRRPGVVYSRRIAVGAPGRGRRASREPLPAARLLRVLER